MSKQNLGSSIKKFGGNPKAIKGRAYNNTNFSEVFEDNESILKPGDKYYDFDEPTILKTKT